MALLTARLLEVPESPTTHLYSLLLHLELFLWNHFNVQKQAHHFKPLSLHLNVPITMLTALWEEIFWLCIMASNTIKYSFPLASILYCFQGFQVCDGLSRPLPLSGTSSNSIHTGSHAKACMHTCPQKGAFHDIKGALQNACDEKGVLGSLGLKDSALRCAPRAVRPSSLAHNMGRLQPCSWEALWGRGQMMNETQS